MSSWSSPLRIINSRRPDRWEIKTKGCARKKAHNDEEAFPREAVPISVSLNDLYLRVVIRPDGCPDSDKTLLSFQIFLRYLFLMGMALSDIVTDSCDLFVGPTLVAKLTQSLKNTEIEMIISSLLGNRVCFDSVHTHYVQIYNL